MRTLKELLDALKVTSVLEMLIAPVVPEGSSTLSRAEESTRRLLEHPLFVVKAGPVELSLSPEERQLLVAVGATEVTASELSELRREWCESQLHPAP
jgi:hypothetical protein